MSLQKQAKAAPKYTLKMEGLDLFVSKRQGLTGCNLTSDKKDALKYSVGFDCEKTKVDILRPFTYEYLNRLRKIANSL